MLTVMQVVFISPAPHLMQEALRTRYQHSKRTNAGVELIVRGKARP